VILGELLRAEELLVRATELDPGAPELAYSHGRVLEDLRLHDDAMAEYCRADALGAEDVGILDSQARIDALYELVRAGVPERARQAFLAGLAEADRQDYEDAGASFTTALEELPDLAPAVFNRALVLEQLGRLPESLVDYRRYLELIPSELDPIVTSVSERIGTIEGLINQPTPSPPRALALGVAFPGMGQFYSGRRTVGIAVLSLSAGAIATGIMVKKITVTCLASVEPGQSCPPGLETGRSSRRPYLTPALGLTGAVMVAGAIEAFIRARSRRAESNQVADARRTAQVRITGPRITAARASVDVSFLGIRF
jgi:tetratricopeptide (TPR) repeat protein